MIVPMYKYTFLVYHANYTEFLKDIRKIGVLHISEKSSESTPAMQELFRHITEVDRSIKKLEWLTPEAAPMPHELTKGAEVFERIRSIDKEIEHNHHLLVHLEKEQKQLTPWGDFDWAKVHQLQENGLFFRFLSCPVRKYLPEWESEYYIKIVGDLDGYRYFVKLEKSDSAIQFPELPGADELNLPTKSLQQIFQEKAELNAATENLNHELHQLAYHCKGYLSEYYQELQQKLSELNARLQTTSEVEGKVQLLEGWVPDTHKNQLDQYLQSENILFTAEKPEEEDRVPILLKNNRFAKLYEVVGRLYDLPNHRELDLVPFFAPFYMMFFGFSLGDAGYGLFIIAAAGLAKRKMPSIKPVLSLAQWLGLSTVIFGILTGTFFGIDVLNTEIAWLESFKRYMISTDQLFNLAIIFGVIQIIFGMVLKVVNITRMRGFMHSLSTIGWIILLVGSGVVYGLQSTQSVGEVVAKVLQYGVLGISGLFILFLNHPKRNPLINFGAGLWDIYSMATSLLGDLLSYIRLFALGVSSAILGLVFNSMAMSMKPDNIILGPVVMILILVIGHSITLFMSALGAFVHPIRLTFVEFYKNAGFTGGGQPYKPFAEPKA